MLARRQDPTAELLVLLLPVVLVAVLAEQVPRLRVRTLLEILRFLLDRLERG